MQTAELMETVLKAGEIMLTSGAEIYRVEETIVRICKSYNVESESFVLPTGIFISIREKDGSMQTSFKRIRQRTVDLNRIDRVNTFSRSLMKTRMSYEEAAAELAGIEAGKYYGLPARLAAATVASFVFTMLFRGSWYDSITAAVIGLIVYLMKEGLGKKGFFQFFELFLAGLAAGFLSIAAVRLFPDLNEYKIIIGSVMLYLPGLAMTNGIKDAFYGDLVASFTRIGEAFLIAVAVAAGVAISLSISLNWG
jgi:uncharacterized membrane protein YjjP (DUF1212 family)